MSDPLQSWPAFAAKVRSRLDAGRLAYGDRSFEADPTALVAELQQECRDLAGWGFVLHERLERAREALDGTRAVDPRPGAPVILGLDLSATAAAACAVPLDWDGDWRRIKTLTVGESLRRDATDEERARRCDGIATRIVAFARENGVSEAWLESYAYSRRDSAHTLAEVGGVVRLELVRAGIAIRTAQMSTARKLLLGALPRSEAKQACHRALHAAGSPPWTLDEADAFVAANLGLSEHPGAFCFAQYPEAA